MAENRGGAQAPNQNARGGSARRGGRGGGQTPAVFQLNPERAPALISKWQKSLGTDLERIEVIYDVEGINVHLYGKEGTPFHVSDEDGNESSISVPRYRELKAAASQPSDDEKLRAFRDKFELRLNRAVPAPGPVSGSDTDIRAFLEGLDFQHRRAMLMSNKQFRSAYPNGFAEG